MRVVKYSICQHQKMPTILWEICRASYIMTFILELLPGSYLTTVNCGYKFYDCSFLSAKENMSLLSVYCSNCQTKGPKLSMSCHLDLNEVLKLKLIIIKTTLHEYIINVIFYRNFFIFILMPKISL